MHTILRDARRHSKNLRTSRPAGARPTSYRPVGRLSEWKVSGISPVTESVGRRSLHDCSDAPDGKLSHIPPMIDALFDASSEDSQIRSASAIASNPLSPSRERSWREKTHGQIGIAARARDAGPNCQALCKELSYVFSSGT